MPKVKSGLTIILIAILTLSLSSCTVQDTTIANQLGRIAYSADQLIKSWDANKVVLQKYHDRLPAFDPDRLKIQQLITTGTEIAKELDQLSYANRLPSLAAVKSLFTEADSAVQTGRDLYTTYEADISQIDKFRAKNFMDIWLDIQRDVIALTTQSSNNQRYNLTRDLLSFALMITGQIIIPSLQAAGKI